jgi:hypothetical protein
LTARDYQKPFDELAGKGYRPVLVNGYAIGGNDYYAAIWEQKTEDDWAARHTLPTQCFQKAFDEFAHNGYRLVSLSGYAVGQIR